MIRYMSNGVSDTVEAGTPTGRATSLNPNGLIAAMGGEPFRNVSTAQSKSWSASEGPKLASYLWRTGPGLIIPGHGRMASCHPIPIWECM